MQRIADAFEGKAPPVNPHRDMNEFMKHIESCHLCRRPVDAWNHAYKDGPGHRLGQRCRNVLKSNANAVDPPADDELCCRCKAPLSVGWYKRKDGDYMSLPSAVN